MENNSSNLDSTANQTSYSIQVRHKPEVPYMITEGRLEHLEQIASQIEKYENWESKWDILKILMGIFGTAALFGLGILIPDYITAEKNIHHSLVGRILEIISFSSLFGTILCFIYNFKHNKERKEQIETEAQKIKNILAKVRESLEK